MSGRKLRRSQLLLVAWLAALLLAPLRGKADTFCAGPITGAPGSPRPTIDGMIEGDLPYGQSSDVGWTGSSGSARTDGVDIPRVAWRAGTATFTEAASVTRTSLYLGVTFDAFTEFSYDDVLVLAFQVGPTDYRRFIIYPAFANQLGDMGTPKRPRELTYYTGVPKADGTKVAWTEQSTNPWYQPGQPVTDSRWIEAAVGRPAPTAASPNPTKWELELRVPIKSSASEPMGIPMPTKFYFAAFDTHGGSPAATGTDQWPSGIPPSGNVITQVPPDPATWPAFSSGSSCAGLSIYSNDLGTNHSKPGLPNGQFWASTYIDRFQPNRFKATVHNNTGGPVDGISAVFFLANFGVPSEPSWRKVPAPSNPTAPARVDSPSTDLWTGDWTFSDDDRSRYPEGAARCLRAELLEPSSGPTVNFVAKTAWANIKFLTGSTFQGSAEISAKGYGAPRPGAQKRRFSLDVGTTSQLARATGNAPKVERGTLVAQQLLRFRAYLDVDGYVVINGNRYEYQVPVGSFMYVVDHPLPATLAARVPLEFKDTAGLTGPMAMRDAKAPPSAILPADVVAELSEAVDPKKWSYQLTGIEKSPSFTGRYTLDVEPEQVAQVTLKGAYQECTTGCCCRRIPTSSLGLVAFGLLALAPRSRRREP